MTSEDEPGPPRIDSELRSFGRRRGRKPSPRQADLTARLLPKLCLDLQTLPPSPLCSVFPHAPDDVWLEIGFGGGEHLLWQAEQAPEVGILGCEPFLDGVVKVLSAIEANGLSNVRLHDDDARDLLRWLPDASIARAFILFPDPWPKARQRKRRLVNRALFASLARVIRPGGELRLATDIGDYAAQMLSEISSVTAFAWTAERPDNWRVQPDDWPVTRYQQKAQREGRKSVFLSFDRN